MIKSIILAGMVTSAGVGDVSSLIEERRQWLESKDDRVMLYRERCRHFAESANRDEIVVFYLKGCREFFGTLLDDPAQR